MAALRTCAEVAGDLHISIRKLQALIQRYQPPVIAAGRTVLFDDQAYTYLIEAMRRPVPKTRYRHDGSSESVEREFARAMALVAKALKPTPRNRR